MNSPTWNNGSWQQFLHSYWLKKAEYLSKDKKKKTRKLITKDMEDVNLKIVHEIHFQFHDLSTFTQ